jgi:hypothetical protein
MIFVVCIAPSKRRQLSFEIAFHHHEPRPAPTDAQQPNIGPLQE